MRCFAIVKRPLINMIAFPKELALTEELAEKLAGLFVNSL